MWATRGGGGNFGTVAEFRLRAVPTPAKVFSGFVFYSFDQVSISKYRRLNQNNAVSFQFSILSPLLADHSAINPLPTSALITMVMDFGRALGSTEFVPMIGIAVYDALGESHARTTPSAESGFSWLWDIRGGPKAERLSEGTYEETMSDQASSAALFGLTSCHGYLHPLARRN